MKYSAFATTLLAVLSAIANTPAYATDDSLGGLELLQRTAEHYTRAKSYHIEAVEESTTTNEYEHNWNKAIFVAAEDPSGRFHYEGRSTSGEAWRVSDGTNVWTYHADEHLYTKSPRSIFQAKHAGLMPMQEMALWEAEDLRHRLATLADRYKSAHRLPDETVAINGRPIPCSVVRIETSDLKRNQSGFSVEETFWIDKTANTVLKSSRRANTYSISGTAHIPIHIDETTIYAVTELDDKIQEALFTFVPPANSTLIASFSDPMKHGDGPDLTGHIAPSLPVKSSDGSVLNLESFRGKPVLLDVWATWCSPCVKGLADLAKLRAAAKNTNLIFLTVDEDEDAKTATDFLAKNGYTWPNFHDGDATVSKAVGSSAVPQTILIDAKGKIVFDQQRYTEDDLRRAIAALGPEYASLAPKPPANPCVASK
jgi:thiol-disulfide isomerase/thioredoxin